MFIKEGKVLQLDSPDPKIVTKKEITINPTKSQFHNLLEKDRYHFLRGFLVDDNLYCWQGFYFTHDQAQKELLRQFGLELEPVCGIAFNNIGVELAQSWKKTNITPELEKIISTHPRLEYLYGKNYPVKL